MHPICTDPSRHWYIDQGYSRAERKKRREERKEERKKRKRRRKKACSPPLIARYSVKATLTDKASASSLMDEVAPLVIRRKQHKQLSRTKLPLALTNEGAEA